VSRDRDRLVGALAPPLEVGGALLVIPYLAVSAQAPASPLAIALNLISWGSLLLALVLRRTVASGWRAFGRDQWLSIAVLIVSVPVTQAEALHALRLIRLVAVLRLAGPARKATYLLASRGGIAGLGALAALTVILGGVIFGAVEPTVAAGSWDGIWWSLQTATTVGYGGVVPTNDAGRAVGVVVMLLGVSLVAAFTAALASVITRVSDESPEPSEDAIREMAERMERIEGHLLALRRRQEEAGEGRDAGGSA